MIGTELNTGSERIANQNQMLRIVHDEWVPLINAGITLFDYDLATFDYQMQKSLYRHAGMSALFIKIFKNPAEVTDFIIEITKKLYQKNVILGATIKKVWSGILVRWTFDPSAVREHQEEKAQSDMETEVGNHEEGLSEKWDYDPEAQFLEINPECEYELDRDTDMELRAELEAERKADEYRERQAEGW